MSTDSGFPFTLLCISLSQICLEVLRSGGLVVLSFLALLVQKFPFALLCISLSQICLGLLRSGGLVVLSFLALLVQKFKY
jgi:apolipoprotein N-acyltransferase